MLLERAVQVQDTPVAGPGSHEEAVAEASALLVGRHEHEPDEGENSRAGEPEPCPAAARANACPRVSSSGCRPTKRVSPRLVAACKRRRMALAPVSSKTSTGAVRPLTGTGPKLSTRTSPSTSRSVAAVSRMLPGVASCSMRAARCVV